MRESGFVEFQVMLSRLWRCSLGLRDPRPLSTAHDPRTMTTMTKEAVRRLLAK